MAKEKEVVEEVEPVKVDSKSNTKDKAKPASNNDSMKLMSMGLYAMNTAREDITDVLQAGFRVWMKTAKNESLRSRSTSEWDKLFDEYLKS